MRLTIGTGGRGGFTTYSALAADTVIVAGGHPGRVIAYSRATAYSMAAVTLAAATSLAGTWFSRGYLRPAQVDESGHR